MKPSDVAVYVDPFSRRNEEDRIFDPASQPDAGDNAFEPFAYLRSWLEQRGVEVHTADLLESGNGSDRAVKVFISLGGRQRSARLAGRDDVVLSGFFAFECPVVLPSLYADLHRLGERFRRVFSFTTEEAVRPFLRGPVELTRFMLPQSWDDVHERVWGRRDRDFLVMVTGNKQTRVKVNELYSERLRAIEYFNRFGEIALYGRDWDSPPARMATRLPRAVARLERRGKARWHALRPTRDPVWAAVRQAHRGPALDKPATLAGYTFAICYENMILEGWITEKIFDCFYAGTIPVYWGAPDIEQWIPPECYVDRRRFESYDDLREFLRSRSPEQIEGYRVAARDFLRSDRFTPFSKRTFAERIGRLVEEDTGVSLEPIDDGARAPRGRP